MAPRPGRKKESIPPDDRRCTARSKQHGDRCRKWAVPGYRVCRYHGARGGAPKGSKNALKTGEYETIWADQLTDEERELYERIKTDKLAQIDQQIKLTEIRVRRMLRRIASLREQGEDKPGVVETIDLVGRSDAFGRQRQKTVRREANLERIQRIEEGLTRVQARMAQLIKLKHELETGQRGTGDELDRLINALERDAAAAQAGEAE